MFRSTSLLSLLIIVLLSGGCNVARIHSRVCEKRLVRNGFEQHVFVDSTGPHAVWSNGARNDKVLLLHGYSGTGKLQWSRTAAVLATDHQVIMPDLLCHGKSTTTWHGQNMEAQVAHVLLLLDSLHISDPVTVVGNSYGGGVAAFLAEKYPQRVKKLVVYDGLLSDYSKHMADSLAVSVGAADIMDVLGNTSYKALRKGIKLSLYRNPPIPGFMLKQIYNVNVAAYRPAQVTLLLDLMAHEERYIDKQFNWPMPVYFIWGERDELIPNSVCHKVMQRNQIPEDHLTIIPRTGHVANLEQPKEFDKALREIFAKP